MEHCFAIVFWSEEANEKVPRVRTGYQPETLTAPVVRQQR